MGVCAIIYVVMQECPSTDELDTLRARLRHALGADNHCDFQWQKEGTSTVGRSWHDKHHRPTSMRVVESEFVFDVDVWWRHTNHKMTALCCQWLTACLPPGSSVYVTTDHSPDHAEEATPEFIRKEWEDAWDSWDARALGPQVGS